MRYGGEGKEKSPRQTGDQPSFSAADDCGDEAPLFKALFNLRAAVGSGPARDDGNTGLARELGWAVEEAKYAGG